MQFTDFHLSNIKVNLVIKNWEKDNYFTSCYADGLQVFYTVKSWKPTKQWLTTITSYII